MCSHLDILVKLELAIAVLAAVYVLRLLYLNRGKQDA